MTNPQKNLIDNAQAQADKARSNNSGDKYIAQATVYAIESNGKVEAAIKDFNQMASSQAKSTDILAKSQVKLARAQVFLGLVAIIISLVVLIAR